MRTLKPVLVIAGLSAVLLALILLPQHTLLAAPSATKTFTVDTTEDRLDIDTSDGDCLSSAGTCSLRGAIMQANHFTGAGVVTIILPAGTYTLTRIIHGVDGEEEGDLNLTTPLGVNQSINVVGAGANVTIINANLLDRVMLIEYQRVVSISGVSLRNGSVSGAQAGGAIWTDGSTTLTNVTVSGNKAPIGGGIYNGSDGILTVANSTISANLATDEGAGIYNANSLAIVNSTLSGNSANNNGGGVYNKSTGEVNVYNATIYSNEANHDLAGGGVGGGVYNESTGIFNVRNALVAGNYLANSPVYDDCTGAVGEYGNNLIGLSDDAVSGCSFGGSGSHVHLNSTDYLSDLQDNGGPTWTIALLPGSNAIDYFNTVCIGPDSNPLPTDQRGSPRVAGANCDIGAYEYIPPVFLPIVTR